MGQLIKCLFSIESWWTFRSPTELVLPSLAFSTLQILTLYSIGSFWDKHTLILASMKGSFSLTLRSLGRMHLINLFPLKFMLPIGFDQEVWGRMFDSRNSNCPFENKNSGAMRWICHLLNKWRMSIWFHGCIKVQGQVLKERIFPDDDYCLLTFLGHL